MNKAVFFVSCTATRGLTYHFSRQIVDMYLYGNNIGWDTYCVSLSCEQYPGLWDYVRQNIPGNNIILYDNTEKDALLKVLSKSVKNYEDVVIHVQGFKQLKELRSLFSKKIKCILTIHSFYNTPFIKRYFKGAGCYLLANRYASKILFLSPFAMRGFLGGKRLIEKGKVVHIPFCLPFDNQIIESSYISNSGFNIVYLAAFYENKGHELYFPSIEKFAKEHHDVHFWFFGEGPRRKAFLQKVMDSGLEDHVHCPGRIDRKYIPGILKKAQLAMVISHKETAGHAFLEPIIYGCPVIGSRVGFAEYLIQDYITSYGVDTVGSLYDAFCMAYNNQEEMSVIAKRLQKIVKATFDYEAMIGAYYHLYEDVIR